MKDLEKIIKKASKHIKGHGVCIYDDKLIELLTDYISEREKGLREVIAMQDEVLQKVKESMQRILGYCRDSLNERTNE